MKKKVIFRSGSLRMGGLERVLIEVLQTIDKEKFDLYLKRINLKIFHTFFLNQKN